MKPLIIKNEKELRKYIVTYLSWEGYLCKSAEDNEEGAKISVCNYSSFIIDIILPKGTGLDLIKEVKKTDMISL